MKRILFIAGLLSLILSACGPKATPTIDPVQIQASAAAAASTMIALTQQAIPTATNTPEDTPTPLPSPTSIPTMPVLDLSTPTQQSAPVAANTPIGNDPCNGPLSASATGPDARNVVIQNTTNRTVVLALYLNKTPFGECGIRSFNIGPKGVNTLSNLKAGCYNASAFVGVQGEQGATKAFGYFCIPNDGHKYTIYIKSESVSLS